MESAEKLQEACCAYFEKTTNEPLYEDKVFSYEGVQTHEPVEKMVPFTMTGLCLYLGIAQSTWQQWREKPHLSVVAKWADNVIKEQKFRGAAAGFFNTSLISRDLGLTDKKEVDHKSSDGSMATSEFNDMTKQILSEIEGEDDK